MKLFAGLLVLLSGALLAAPAEAAPVPDMAYGAYQAGHYRRALAEALIRIEADSSDAAAMTLVGELYRQGLGVAPDPKIATEWYERAETRGDINATFALATQLLDEKSGKRDAARAGALLEKAAAAGHPAANYNLAIALLAANRQEDDKRAVACLEIAAKAQVGDAMYALGVLAKQGRGMPASEEVAARWMKQASAAGNVPGEVEYAIMLFNGTGVEKDEAAAASLFRRAAWQGNPIAQNRLAKLYQFGLGIAPDTIEAAAWHLAARSQGLKDDALDDLFERLKPEQQARAARMAASRISSAVLTAP
ncbi:MAG: sel1 repeat family protein [Bosea sp.]|uniref:tetratricopeptide repeat protein n=1 Tax=Bosea sp. (in: a-proteobacteria) TaxID=1871050 RepID=UPI001AC1C2F6|nr:tetratricopeptide repeat protein [Bosea sp. (in: a-proteobacteria)]MBN9452412.1 sel1 repeat family protein [Bosea sp. (in: a-proteobacteria)]